MLTETEQHLVHRVAIQDVMLNYAAGIDDRNYEQYKSCFADSVEVLNFGTKTFTGIDAWLEYVWSALEKYDATQHLLGQPLISLSGNNAQLRTDVQALHYLKGEDKNIFTLWATYETRMRQIAGNWKITQHRLVVRGTQQI